MRFAASSTSWAWPGTDTLRQIRAILPSLIRKVVRSTPIYFAAIHALLRPHAIGVESMLGLIGGKRQREVVFFAEFRVARHAVGRKAEDVGSRRRELGTHRVEVDRLLGAARRVVFWVEVEDKLASREILKLDGRALDAEKYEVRRRIALS